MTDAVNTLLIDVRASTHGFAQDVANMRSTFDGTLVDGFSRAGGVLEKGLLGAIKRSNTGFDDLKRVALSAMTEIAAASFQSLFPSGGKGGGGSTGGGIAGALTGIGTSLLGSLLGLPGRATGGPVAPGQAYLVGERGPEVFVPGGTGNIVNRDPRGGTDRSRDVRVSISVISPTGASAPQGLQRSTRQIASAVRRALVAS